MALPSVTEDTLGEVVGADLLDALADHLVVKFRPQALALLVGVTDALRLALLLEQPRRIEDGTAVCCCVGVELATSVKYEVRDLSYATVNV